MELALLAASAAIVLRLIEGWWRWPLAITAVVVLAAVWGLLLSPKAAIPLPTVLRELIEAILVLGVATGFFLVGFTVLAIVGAIIWAIDRVAIWLLER